MLELKNITKTYQPKSGAPVQALKDVSLSFEDKGMVFVLGKSGSGKSTLLNIIGGLDFADSGEISIDGKSTKQFKEKDYDAYRNTYIGFVFQEYNILNEFTVGENISLALELQNRKGEKQKVEEILKEVGLEGYADRKSNELSGGQRQRVAIARAIIKEPKIVMADEPTGALDSETGRGILDTLKRLSRDRLVIVVSHDREFAEEYGDRIIELADGEVISDSNKIEMSEEGGFEAVETKKSVKKSKLPFRRAFYMGAKNMSLKPLRLVVTVIICLISLTFFGLADAIGSFDKDRAAYDSIIKNNYDTVAVTSGAGALDEDLEYLKEQVDIDFLGVVNYGDSFVDLPLTYKRKVYGYDGTDTYYNGMLCGYLPASKVIGDKYKLIEGRTPQNADEIVVSKYTYEQLALGGIRIVDGEDVVYIEPENISTTKDFVDNAYLQVEGADGYVYWDIVGIVDTIADPDGRYSQLKPDAQRDMSLEKYKLLSKECLNYFNYSYHSLGYVSDDAYNAIRGIRQPQQAGLASMGSVVFSKEGSDESSISFASVLNDKDLDKFHILWADGNSHATLQSDEFVIGTNALDNFAKIIPGNKQIELDNTYFGGLIEFSSFAFTIGTIKDYVGLDIGVCETAENLSKESLQEFKDFINAIGSDENDREYGQMLRSVAVRRCFEEIKALLRTDYKLDSNAEDFDDVQWRLLYAGYLMANSIDFYDMIPDIDGGYIDNVVTGQLSGEEIKEKYGMQLYVDIMLKELNEVVFDGVSFTFTYGVKESKFDISPKVVGVYYSDESAATDTCVVNNLLFEEAKKYRTPQYMFLIAQMPKDKGEIKKLVGFQYDDSSYYIHNSVILGMEEKGNTLVLMGKIFLYVGLGLAIFSIVLMSNYISVSIASQKRQIGILRALGAKKSNVFAIFYSESLIISIIYTVLSIVIAAIIGALVGAALASDLGLQITLISFGIRQVLLMLALGLGSSLISSLLSIYSIAKRKPIDCISDK